jgi:hypothetical protein
MPTTPHSGGMKKVAEKYASLMQRIVLGADDGDKLRHSKFVELQVDKVAREA